MGLPWGVSTGIEASAGSRSSGESSGSRFLDCSLRGPFSQKSKWKRAGSVVAESLLIGNKYPSWARAIRVGTSYFRPPILTNHDYRYQSLDNYADVSTGAGQPYLEGAPLPPLASRAAGVDRG